MPRRKSAAAADSAVATIEGTLDDAIATSDDTTREPDAPRGLDALLSELSARTDNLRTAQEREQAELWEQYVAVLRRLDDPRPGDVAWLADAVSDGFVTEDQIRADREIITSATAKLDFLQGFDRQANDELDSATRQEFRQLKAHAEAETKRLRHLIGSLQSDRNRFTSWSVEIRQMAIQRPELFGPGRLELPARIGNNIANPGYETGRSERYAREYNRLAGSESDSARVDAA